MYQCLKAFSLTISSFLLWPNRRKNERCLRRHKRICYTSPVMKIVNVWHYGFLLSGGGDL